MASVFQGVMKFLSLKWLEGIKWVILDNNLYTLYQSDIDLDELELNKLFNYINVKLLKNNDDIDIEDFFYESIVDDIFSPNFKQNYHKTPVEKKLNLAKEDIPVQSYVSWKNNIYELVID